MVNDSCCKLPLSFSIGTKITKEHVQLAYDEAISYPSGSRGRKVFLAYARRLEDECARQEELDKPVGK